MGGPKIGIAVASRVIFEAQIEWPEVLRRYGLQQNPNTNAGPPSETGWNPATMLLYGRGFAGFGLRPDGYRSPRREGCWWPGWPAF